VSGPVTNNRAELYAALWAVIHALYKSTLCIITDSTYVIHSVCHWAAFNAARGWKCCNADILCDLVEVITKRPAVTMFQWVKGHSGNEYNDATDALAKEGTTLEPHVAAYICLSHRSYNHIPVPSLPGVCKVYTTLPRIPNPTQSTLKC
jgi:ribonuclease HI